MIESIQIAGVATYDKAPQSLSGLSKINYLYGSNGSGKTTITRVIANEIGFPTCTVNWKGGTTLQTMVYNRDFVSKNFSPAAELKGIFTLGEQDVVILNRIEAAKGELEISAKKIAALNATLHGDDGLSGKKGELAASDETLKNKCWAAYTKHKPKLAPAFDGFRNSKENFRDKVLKEQSSNSATLETLEYLENKAQTVFGPPPTTESLIQPVTISNFAAYESNGILKKRVIGKEDVDIAAMITRLGNSDWVREGRSFYDSNNETCPFCQQRTTSAFTASLNDYFNEAFATDTKTIDDLISNYATDAVRLQHEINAILNASCKFIDGEKLSKEKVLLDSQITVNSQRLSFKKREPSQVVDLESLSNVLSNIKGLINAANDQINSHNTMVANLAQEKRTLTAQIWKYLCQVEINAALAAYSTEKNRLNKAIAGLMENITAATADRKTKADEIRKLEKVTTSIQPTIDGINGLLSSFGFHGFTLAKADNGTCYKLVRADGSDAKETLSEGERTFITFLYFYHLLKGSYSETGMTTNRVVVFDDPVSSLDSDILFIVGSLIKGLFEDIRAGAGDIKQIFVLTHNVYFHKEVTFNSKRSNGKAMKSEETFWVVRKSNLVSKLENHEINPIKTSYELLWSEVRRSDRSNLTIQNTLRRILENYFKILGGVDLDKLNAMFEGKEKLICKSLVSWVNDGSHFAHDDLYVSIDDSMIEPYLNVFRVIFEKSDHSAHYKMMMGDAFVEMPINAANTAAAKVESVPL